MSNKQKTNLGRGRQGKTERIRSTKKNTFYTPVLTSSYLWEVTKKTPNYLVR